MRSPEELLQLIQGITRLFSDSTTSLCGLYYHSIFDELFS